MLVLISGGSGSGKSAFAERVALSLEGQKHIYLATMQVIPGDQEGEERVRRHRQMREGKGFLTVEGVESLSSDLYTGAVVLLEDLPNLLSGIMFGERILSEKEAFNRAKEGILSIEKEARALVVVTGDIYREGRLCSGDLRSYIECLGRLSAFLVERSSYAYEMVAGIPLSLKGKDNLLGQEEVRVLF